MDATDFTCLNLTVSPKIDEQKKGCTLATAAAATTDAADDAGMALLPTQRKRSLSTDSAQSPLQPAPKRTHLVHQHLEAKKAVRLHQAKLQDLKLYLARLELRRAIAKHQRSLQICRNDLEALADKCSAHAQAPAVATTPPPPTHEETF